MAPGLQTGLALGPLAIVHRRSCMARREARSHSSCWAFVPAVPFGHIRGLWLLMGCALLSRCQSKVASMFFTVETPNITHLVMQSRG